MSTVATALTVRYTMLGFMLKLVTASCLFYDIGARLVSTIRGLASKDIKFSRPGLNLSYLRRADRISGSVIPF
jgi:hypothetical protein